MPSNADKQPSIYDIPLSIGDATLDDALLDAVAAEGGKPVHVLRTDGTFGKHLHAVIVEALRAHLLAPVAE